MGLFGCIGGGNKKQDAYSVVVFGAFSNWVSKKLVHDFAAVVQQNMESTGQGAGQTTLFFFVDVKQEFNNEQLFIANGMIPTKLPINKHDPNPYTVTYKDDAFVHQLLETNRSFPEFLWVEKAFKPEVMTEFKARMHYVYFPVESGEVSCDLHGTLAHERIHAVEQATAKGARWNRIFYASIPPSRFARFGSVVDRYLRPKKPAVCRLVIEKPFGMNTKEALNLNAHLERLFPAQVLRTDHFLANNMVRWIPLIRFCHTEHPVLATIQSVWNAGGVRRVFMRWSTQGDLRAGRAKSYFDAVGIIRDMVQNHILITIASVVHNKPKGPSRRHQQQVQKRQLKEQQKAQADSKESIPRLPTSSSSAPLPDLRVDDSNNVTVTIPSWLPQAVSDSRAGIISRILPLVDHNLTLGQYDTYTTAHGGSVTTATGFHFHTHVVDGEGGGGNATLENGGHNHGHSHGHGDSEDAHHHDHQHNHATSTTSTTSAAHQGSDANSRNLFAGVEIVATGAYATVDRVFEVMLELNKSHFIPVEDKECDTIRLNLQTSEIDLLCGEERVMTFKLSNITPKAALMWDAFSGVHSGFVGQQEIVSSWEFVERVLDKPSVLLYPSAAPWREVFKLLESVKHDHN